MLLPIQKSAAKTWVAVDSEIGSQNCIAADWEIGSQKLCRFQFRNRRSKLCLCRFENQQPNYAAADSEIGSDDGVISTLLISSVF